jgi:hypothetical protein
MKNEETRLHCAAVDYMRRVCPDCLTWHAANGGKRSKETARLMKRLGVLPGVFDLVVLAPGPRTFFLEAKTDKGKLSEDQQWFKGELIKMGFSYVVFRNLDDISDFIIQNKIPNILSDRAARTAVA